MTTQAGWFNDQVKNLKSLINDEHVGIYGKRSQAYQGSQKGFLPSSTAWPNVIAKIHINSKIVEVSQKNINTHTQYQ